MLGRDVETVLYMREYVAKGTISPSGVNDPSMVAGVVNEVVVREFGWLPAEEASCPRFCGIDGTTGVVSPTGKSFEGSWDLRLRVGGHGVGSEVSSMLMMI